MSLSALALGASAGAVGAGLSMFGQQVQYEQQKKLMDKSFEQAQQAQKNSALNMREAYQKAGISTASLAGGNFSPAQGQAPQAPTMNMAQGAFSGMEAFKQLALMNAERDLKVANTQESVANANYVADEKSDNTRADSLLKSRQEQAVDRDLQFARDRDIVAILQFRKDNPEVWKKFVESRFMLPDVYGKIPSFEEAEETAMATTTIGLLLGQSEVSENEERLLRSKLNREVLSRQLKDKAVVKALSKAPYTDQSRIKANITSLVAMADKIRSETVLLKKYGDAKNSAEVSKLNASIQETKQNIKNLIAEENESIQRAEYWSSAEKNQIAQTVRNSVGVAIDIVGAVKGFPSAPAASTPSAPSARRPLSEREIRELYYNSPSGKSYNRQFGDARGGANPAFPRDD